MPILLPGIMCGLVGAHPSSWPQVDNIAIADAVLHRRGEDVRCFLGVLLGCRSARTISV